MHTKKSTNIETNVPNDESGLTGSLQPLGDYTSVSEEIRRQLDRLTPTELKPARHLLAYYPFAGLETVSEFAKSADVSAPTVLRLVTKLGFNGYAEFQRTLRKELEDRLKTPLTRESELLELDAQSDYLDRFALVVADNIRESFRNVPRVEFDAVLALMANKKLSISCLGGRLTDTLAKYLYLHLHAVRAQVRHIEGQTDTWPEYLLDMGKRDVLVVFDIRRYQPDVIHFAEEAARRGVTVVLFTDLWLSPIARVAKHSFPLRVGTPSNWDSGAATIAVIEALIGRLNKHYWKDVKSRMVELENLRREFKAVDSDHPEHSNHPGHSDDTERSDYPEN